MAYLLACGNEKHDKSIILSISNKYKKGVIAIDIKDTIDNLNLISDVIPDYSGGRMRGLSDKESERVSLEAISEAIELLEKQHQNNIKEYILLVGNDVFRIYAHNQNEGISTFGKACFNFRNTSNQHYKEYWDNFRGLMLADKYTIIENTDFVGVRKIT